MIAPLAYKSVAIAVMLLEINYCSSQLRLPIEQPVGESNLKAQFVYHPSVIGFAGRLDTAGYSFSFARTGRLRFITKLNENGGMSFGNHQLGFGDAKPILNTNEAYRMATNWLYSIDVNVSELEKRNPPIVKQRGRSETNGVPLIFDLKWGKWSDPAVVICMTGAGELLTLRQEDDSYSRRPGTLLKNIDELLDITDDEFWKLSLLQRSNLVARFSAVTYSFSNAAVISLPSPHP